MANPTACKFSEPYVPRGDNGAADPLEVPEAFWPDLMSGKLALGPGRLVTFYEFGADWDSWEMHPNGEEIVLMISGSMDLLLERSGGVETVPLREPGGFSIVPHGIWHTAKVNAPSRAMSIAAGEGTEHRPV